VEQFYLRLDDAFASDLASRLKYDRTVLNILTLLCNFKLN